MRPSVTILQLDTDFPRVAGDVACPDTYYGEIEILRVSKATVGQIVSADPAAIPIAPFEFALAQAQGEIIVTSCGFLSFWQDTLACLTDRPFISSALTALPELCKSVAAEDILTVTFDANSLNVQHYGPYKTHVIGLSPDLHLHQVITQNRVDLDVDLACREITDLVSANHKSNHKHILLECTNLPPYKRTIAARTGLPITDILTCIEALRPNTIDPSFLTQQEGLL